MGQAEVIAALERDAKDNWDEPYPLVLSDRPFKPTAQNSIFVRHAVVFGEGERIALGTGFYRYPGLQYLSIFFQPGSGNQSIYQYADNIVRYYTDKILVDGDVSVNFQVASTIRFPHEIQSSTRMNQAEPAFAQLQVVCPFYFDTRS